jgi:uncharacterized membrane protein YfcA
MEQLAIFLGTGAVAGVMAGLFGVGGGLIIVPALAWLLPRHGVDASVVMQIAIGTSLASISATSISSTLAHHGRSGVLWPVLLRLAPGLMIGAVAGGFVADVLSGGALKKIVGIGALLVSAQMFLDLKPKTPREPRPPGSAELLATGGVIGLLAALIGIGGGSMTVPYLSLRGVSMREAVGTAAAAGMPIAWAGAIGFMLAGQGQPNLPPLSIGYVSLAGFAGIAAASVLTAPLGARLAHTLPPKTLKRAFALMLCSIGLGMLLG